jgi:hypothetical protein
MIDGVLARRTDVDDLVKVLELCYGCDLLEAHARVLEMFEANTPGESTGFSPVSSDKPAWLRKRNHSTLASPSFRTAAGEAAR